MMDFDDVSAVLAAAGATASAAEVHGRLCGQLSGGGNGAERAERAIHRVAIELLGEDATAVRTLATALQQLHEDCQRALRDTDFSFAPLLPEDDLPLALRIEALASWCQGFLSGLGQSGLRGDTPLSADATDAMRDLAAIALADADVTDDDAGEVAYMELVEYVRVAVLAIFGELGAAPEPASRVQADRRIH